MSVLPQTVSRILLTVYLSLRRFDVNDLPMSPDQHRRRASSGECTLFIDDPTVDFKVPSPTANTFWVGDIAGANWLRDIKVRLFSYTKNEFDMPCVGFCLNIPRGYDSDDHGRRQEKSGGARYVLGNVRQDNYHQVELRLHKDNFDISYGTEIHCGEGAAIKSKGMEHDKFHMRVDLVLRPEAQIDVAGWSWPFHSTDPSMTRFFEGPAADKSGRGLNTVQRIVNQKRFRFLASLDSLSVLLSFQASSCVRNGPLPSPVSRRFEPGPLRYLYVYNFRATCITIKTVVLLTCL